MTASALNPPSTWIAPAPPMSRNPAPRPKFAPSCASQAPPHTQCAKKGNATTASTAANAAPAVSRKRSAPEPHGISTAKARARNSKSAPSCARAGVLANPLKTSGPVPAQFLGLPKISITWPAPAAPSAIVAPISAKARLAAAIMVRQPSNDCAAERDRPRPVFSRATPAGASEASSSNPSVRPNLGS